MMTVGTAGGEPEKRARPVQARQGRHRAAFREARSGGTLYHHLVSPPTPLLSSFPPSKVAEGSTHTHARTRSREHGYPAADPRRETRGRGQWVGGEKRQEIAHMYCNFKRGGERVSNEVPSTDLERDGLVNGE